MTAKHWQLDVVMLGTFATWNLGTLRARALPLASAIQDLGFRVGIVTSPWDMSHEAGVVECIHSVPVINTSSASPRYPFQAVREQLSWVGRLDPQIVHLFKPRGFSGLATRELLGRLPVIVDSDDWEGDGGWNDLGNYGFSSTRLFEWQERSLIAHSDVVTAASTLLAVRAKKLREGVPPETTVLLPNALERSWLDMLQAAGSGRRFSEVDQRIVIYSRFAEFPPDWISSFCESLAARTITPIALHLVGRLPTDVQLANSYGHVSVTAHGYLTRQEIAEILSGASLSVYPYADSLISRAKQSVKLLEQMAAGCPIVATDTGDVKRTLGNAGVAIRSTQPAEYASLAIELLSHPARLSEMSLAGKRRIQKHFTIEPLAERLLDAYRQAGLAMPN